jgi:hypothetical protein
MSNFGERTLMGRPDPILNGRCNPVHCITVPNGSPMNITDPSLWPAGFGPVRIERLGGDSVCGYLFLLVQGDSVLAELSSLDQHYGTLLLDEHQECVLTLNGCWSVDLIPAEGQRSGTHILCPARQTEPDREQPGSELAGWAMLTVLCATKRRPLQRG